MGEIKQKDIVILDLEPTIGHEQKGTRPAVVISSSDFSLSRMIIVCPITSMVKNRAGSLILNPNNNNNLDNQSEILVSQIRTVSIDRAIKKIGTITDKELTQIFNNLDLLLDRFSVS